MSEGNTLIIDITDFDKVVLARGGAPVVADQATSSAPTEAAGSATTGAPPSIEELLAQLVVQPALPSTDNDVESAATAQSAYLIDQTWALCGDIAQLKTENARLKAEIAQLRSQALQRGGNQ